MPASTTVTNAARRSPSKGSNNSRTSSHNSSVSSVKSTISNSSTGSSSFMVGRERDRSAEMEMFRIRDRTAERELFSQSRKPRSNYRRPSNLGLSSTPLPNKTESRNQYCAKAVGRDHIVKAIPDHLKLEGDFQRSTELKANFRNLSPARPIIYKIKDHLKPEGDLIADSESSIQYRNLKPQRPIIHRMRDHGSYVQPEGCMTERIDAASVKKGLVRDDSSEYRGSFQKTAVRGERAAPDWISNFSKTEMTPEFPIKKEDFNPPPPVFAKNNFLDLLASVASDTLMNDKSLQNVKTRPFPRKPESFTFSEVKKMPGATLLRLFAAPEIDEMKKTYKYKCRLIPDECSAVVTSLGNESRAKNQIKSHLSCHVRERRRDFETRLFYPYAIKTEKREEDDWFLKDHSYSLLSSNGKPAVKRQVEEEDDEEQTIHFEQDYSELLGNYQEEKEGEEEERDSVFMDVDGFIWNALCVNHSDAVPYIGCEVELRDIAMKEDFLQIEKASNEKERDAATRAIQFLQSKGSNTPIRDLICTICVPSKNFTAYGTLLSHLKSHIGLKPFECRDCNAHFTRQHSLNYHRLIHENQTRFTCGDCGRKFRHPSHYKEHRRRHTGELPFQCSDCLLRYKTRNTFKRHLRVNHGKILTSSGSVARLNVPDESDPELKEMAAFDEEKKKIQKLPSDGDAGTDSSSSMTDEEEPEKSPVEEEPLPVSFKFDPTKTSGIKKELSRVARTKNPSPVPNFVSDPPAGAITPKKKLNATTVSNGVTISKYSDHSANIENSAKKSFRPSSKSAFKTPGDVYKRVRNNVEIRKLICFGQDYNPSLPPSTSPQTKVKILQESVETNSKKSAILAEIDGKRVLLIPKNEQGSLPVENKPKSKLEECLLYGVQRAKSSI